MLNENYFSDGYEHEEYQYEPTNIDYLELQRQLGI